MSGYSSDDYDPADGLVEVPLYGNLQDKTEECLSTFIKLEESIYSNKQIADSGQNDDFMKCMCEEDYEDDINLACAYDDCINRGTKIECVDDTFNSCGKHCANQRFQRKEYADINVIKTEKKGYGVRAQHDLEPNAFVYEYIGEVIDEKAFKKRMIQYDEEGIKHFYFMMIQKGEFVDATKKGSLGRFLNHSCNPNCYVEKWVVGNKLRMGIFAKRNIQANEELTFNYNVDRYGATAQPCYCGESNCIGFIGGKTQTESASLLPQNYAEALGYSVEDEQEYILKNKDIEKNENNVNAEYIKSLKMEEINNNSRQVNQVIGALMQVDDDLIIDKLLQRIEITKSEDVQKRITLSHGFKAFGILINRFFKKLMKNSSEFEVDLIIRMLKIFLNWPPVSQNTIQKNEIIPVIKNLNIKNDIIVKLSQEVLDRWETFEYDQKIKKATDPNTVRILNWDSRRNNRILETNSGNGNITPTTPTPSHPPSRYDEYELIEGIEYKTFEEATHELHPDWQVQYDDNEGKFYFYKGQETSWNKLQRTKIMAPKLPTGPALSNPVSRPSSVTPTGPSANSLQSSKDYRLKLEEARRKRREQEVLHKKRKHESEVGDLIKQATEEQRRKELEEERKIAAKAEYKAKLKKREEHKRKMQKRTSETEKPKEKPDKQWKSLIGEVVPNIINKKYKLEKEEVKKYSKIITNYLSLKEQGKPVPEKLSSSKYGKIKDYVYAYMDRHVKS